MGHVLRSNFDEKKISVAKFTPHDLRRTAVTHLARLKVPAGMARTGRESSA